MNLKPRRTVLLGGLALTLTLTLAAPEARAFLGGHGRLGQTVYVSPIETSVLVPTSYVSSTSFVSASSYVLPTSSISLTPTVYATSYRPAVYATSAVVRPSRVVLRPTSYLTSSSYLLPTSYVVPTIYSRIVPTTYSRIVPTTTTRFIESSFLTPSTYLTPTTTYLYDLPLVRTSSTICDDEIIIAPPSTSVPADSSATYNGDPPLTLDETQGDRAADSSANQNQNQGRVIESEPAQAQPTQQAPAQAQPPQQAPAQAQPQAQEEPPRAAPLPEPEDPPQLPSFNGEEATPPAVPENFPEPGDLGRRDEELRRMAMRPAAAEPLTPVDSPPVLIDGLVRSGNAADPAPVPDLRVSFVDRRGRFEDRTARTDDSGRFALDYLPDGDWMIEVQGDNDDQPQSYGNITVSGGRVTDSQGRDRSYLVLSR